MSAAPQASAFVNLFPLVVIFVIFYFLLIRPQKNKEKEHQKMLTGLNKNDDVVTTGGIHGTIVNVKDKTVILRVDENVKLEIEKNCVAYIKKPQA
ncbi:MAG: preprotein translocase subunit YajC [Candidatus Omnitrophota bacterium]|nr:preprotein translocase subunit YajC [Candidatus Omnitrophota bacterium]